MTQAAALLAVLLLAACYQTNGNYSPDAMACTADQQCSEAAPICHDETCVQCTAERKELCIDTQPICGANNACRACSAHAECADSKVCLTSGACADATKVAYVAAPSAGGSDNSICTLATPCTKVSEALKLPHSTVMFLGGVTTENVVVDNRNLTFLAAPGAQLKGASSGPVIEMKNRSTLQISDLQITDGLGNMVGHGIFMNGSNDSTLDLRRVTLQGNNGTGIVASAGRVTIERSMISGNNGGGLSLTSTAFTIVNNFIVKNGSPSSTVGGVLFSQVSTPGNKFEFNTVTQNAGGANINTGVECSAVLSAPTLSNSIIYGNMVSGAGAQVGSSCAWTYSAIGPVTDAVIGNGNIKTDPAFESLTNFHLKSTSPARDAADPTATLLVDFDGDVRPQGAQRDMGADEIK